MKPTGKKDVFIREAAWRDHRVIIDFQRRMALETENLELAPDTLEKGVTVVFEDPALGRYFVAESKGKIIASMMTTWEWSDWRNATVWWLQSVFVIPEYRGTGVFRNMYKHVKNLAMKQENVSGIRLYVDKTNIAAQNTYRAVGMDGDHYRVFEWMKE